MRFCFGLLLVQSSVVFASLLHRSIVLPTINNIDKVGVKKLAMIDEARLDPFTNQTGYRELMVSLFYPTHGPRSQLLVDQQIRYHSGDPLTPYMPPATAALYGDLLAEDGVAKGTIERIFTRCQDSAPIPKDPSIYPLIIFSPGAGASRFIYTTIAQEIARKGYIVASLDHPFDALVVEFPDGRLIRGVDIDSPYLVELMVEVRAQDVSFVIDELGSTSLLYPFSVNVNNTVVVGHSLGGATSAEAALNDTRIRGGVNFDGRLFGSMGKPGIMLSEPCLQFGAARNDSFADWDDAWKHLSGWKLELDLEGAQHGTFTDVPLVAEAIGLRRRLGKKGEALWGKVDGLRGLEIVVAYSTAFADYILMRKNSTLLADDGGGEFPEVIYSRRG